MPELRSHINDEDVEMRREAVEALRGKSGGVCIGLLLHAMTDRSWRIRHSAADILLDEHPVEDFIQGLIELLYHDDNAGARNSAIEALVRLGRKATPFLIDAFDTPNRDVRKFIIDVLGEYTDDRSLPLMLNALKDDDENVRVTAIEHIGKVREASVVNSLIQILEGGDLWTSYPAVDALGRIGDRRAVPALVRTLGTKPLRAAAIKSLGLIGDPESLPHIVPFLDEPSKTVQDEAIQSMERFYRNGVSEKIITDEIRKVFGDRILDTLVGFTTSQKPAVKISGILILGLLKDQRAFAPLLEISQEEDFSEEVKRALVFIGSDKPESILALFDAKNINQRRFICDVAGRIASPVYYPTFVNLLHDEDGHIRSLAAGALAKIRDPRAVQKIKSLLTDVYEDVQEAAVEALSDFGTILSTDELVLLLQDPNPTLRKNSALLLGKIGAKAAVPELGFALKDGDVAVRKACIQAFSQLRTEEASKFLVLALADEDPFIRVLSAISLGRIGGEGVFEALSLLVSDSDDSVRVAVAKAFGMLRDGRAVELLMDLLSDRNGFVVTTTIESLSRIDGDAAKSALLGMLKHDDSEVRRTAIKALSPFENVEGDILPFLADKDWATRKAAVEVVGSRLHATVRSELERLLDSEEDPIVKKVIEESLRMQLKVADL